MNLAFVNPDAVAVSESPSSLSIDTLHSLYSQRIFRFLLVSLRDRDRAETLTQETFLRAWTARDQFRGECAALTWLMRIALNLVRDHTRTNRFRLLNANPVDSGKALAEISRIADLRADLEKANAKMLLGLRAVLTADQCTKLQADQHGRGDESRQLREHAGRPASGTPPPPPPPGN